MGLEVAARAARQLRLEAAALLGRVVELAERIRDFEPADVQLESFHGVWIIRPLLGQRRDLGRKIVDEGRLDELLFAQAFEDRRGDLAGAARRINRYTELACDRRR